MLHACAHGCRRQHILHLLFCCFTGCVPVCMTTNPGTIPSLLLRRPACYDADTGYIYACIKQQLGGWPAGCLASLLADWLAAGCWQSQAYHEPAHPYPTHPCKHHHCRGRPTLAPPLPGLLQRRRATATRRGCAPGWKTFRGSSCTLCRCAPGAAATCVTPTPGRPLPWGVAVWCGLQAAI